jgi:hypothetical protein
MITKVKAYASQVTMHFGNSTVTGGLYPIRATAKTPKFKLSTPDGKPVDQVYRDEDGKVWEKDMLKRGMFNEEGVFELISDNAVESAKESRLPLNIFNLTAHDRNEVDRYIFPSTNQAYVFKPILKNSKGKEIKDPVNVQWYDFVNVLLRDSEIALLGMCNLQNHEGLFRLGLYQGWITVQKQLHPEELNQYEYYTPDLEYAVREKAVEVSRRAAQSFNAEEYVNQIAERLAAIQPGVMEPLDGEPLAPVPNRINMLEALESFGV